MQVVYTCVMMLITLTLFAYILGEISNTIMENDEELVKQRSQVGACFNNQSLLDCAMQTVCTSSFPFLAGPLPKRIFLSYLLPPRS